MINPKDCTVIIPHLGATREQCYALNKCLISLQEFSPDLKILVVKNGNIGCSCRRDLRVVAQGQCKAVNAAVATTDTEWIFISNDDMIYSPRWFMLLTEKGWGTMAKDFDPKTMCISPMLIEPITGAPTFKQYPCGGAGGDFDKDKWLAYANKHELQQTGLRTGFNFPVLMKRELWNTIGGYDINYDPFGSNGDSDLQAKVHLAGIQPYQNTNCIVYHFSQTSGTSHPSNRSFWEKNWHYFIQKWGFERASSPEVWISKDIINKEKLIYRPAWMGKYGEVV